MNELKAFLEQHGIFTRLVPCDIDFAYTALDSEISESSLANLHIGQKSLEEQLRAEFIALSSHRHGSLTQWLNKIKSKARSEESDEVLLELLVELYQKVEHIEQILLNQNRPLIPLDFQARARFIGHNVLCLASESSLSESSLSESSLKPSPHAYVQDLNAHASNQSSLTPGKEYYLRLFLPVFPQRYVGIYARALSREILHFTQIHPSDVRDFDSFVAFLEREAILDSKLSRRQKEE